MRPASFWFLFISGVLVATPAAAQGGFGAEFGGDVDVESPAASPPEEPVAEAVSGPTEPTPAPVPTVETAHVVSARDHQVAAPVPPPLDDEDSERERRFRAHNTLGGAVGGFRVVDAGSGPLHSFRLQLALEFFRARGFLYGGDRQSLLSGTLSFSWTPLRFLEVFAAIANNASRNESSARNELFMTLGDTLLGVKGFHSVSPWLTLGGDATLGLLNSVGDVGLVFQGTSFGLRANATADFRALARPVPLITRFGLQYWFDNSARLVRDVEASRYQSLGSPRPPEDEFRHLLRRDERFGLGIQRTDMLRVSLGFEVPLRVAPDFHVSPILEWNLGIPINRQGFDCLFVPESARAPGDDGCLDDAGFAAFPQTVSLGARLLPPVRGLAVLVGADVGITGVRTFVRELAPTAPYRILLGISYAYDTRPPAPIVVAAPPPVPVEKPVVQGLFEGTVVESGTDVPVAEVVVEFPGRELSPILADEKGRFLSYAFPPGSVSMVLRHPDYEAGACVGTVPADADVRPIRIPVRCELVPLPRAGRLEGRVVSQGGGAVGAAVVELSGPASHRLITDAAGRFRLEALPPGSYQVRVDAEDHLLGLDSFEVSARETATPTVTIAPRPAESSVRLRARQIVIRRQVNFATDSADILDSSNDLLSEIADVLHRNPQLRLVEIQGHTDDRGSVEHNMDLSQRRAESVMNALVGRGVAPSRLEARGYGPTRPLLPNITNPNRARNRRVQFVIKEQGETN